MRLGGKLSIEQLSRTGLLAHIVIGPQARTLTARKFERTPARIQRGDYLVSSVLDCMSRNNPATGGSHYTGRGEGHAAEP